MKQLIYISFLLFFSFGFSQTEADSLKLQNVEDTKELFSNNDTLFFKKSDSVAFITHKEATLIDSLWLNELIKSPLFGNTLDGYQPQRNKIFFFCFKE